MEGMDVCRMGTRTSSSSLEELGADNFISGLILSNNLLYNLYSFV